MKETYLILIICVILIEIVGLSVILLTNLIVDLVNDLRGSGIYGKKEK